MEYTVQKLGKLAGVSTRTLRYYDEIGILKPARINSSGYRIYGVEEVNILQQILFYRELGVNLENIKSIITAPDFDGTKVLREHRAKLLAKREQIDLLILNVDKTINAAEGRIKMSDREKFEGFKKNMIEENDRKYGKEIREKYGENTVINSNKKLQNMTEEEYNRIICLEQEFKEILAEAFKTGKPGGELAQKAADLHRQWLSFYWDGYNKGAHAGIVQMYVEDERFTAYYDKEIPGTAEFMREAVLIYTGMEK